MKGTGLPGMRMGLREGTKSCFPKCRFDKEKLGYIDASVQNPHGNETREPQSLLGIQVSLHSCWPLKNIGQLKKFYPRVIIFFLN